MISLFLLYKWTLLAGTLTALGLSLVGAQIASREQSVQTLVVSQASSLGIMLALALSHLIVGHESEKAIIPLLFSFLFAAGFYLICETFVPSKMPSRNSYYIGIFSALLSLTYAVTALVPSLETHMGASFFGDLAVISDLEAILMCFISSVVLHFMLRRWREVTDLSFMMAIFSGTILGKRKRKLERSFLIMALILICSGIQFMGLLYTLTALFLPALAVSGLRLNLKGLTMLLSFVAVFGSLLGFSFSLVHGKLPTVPAIALSFLLIGFLIRLPKLLSRKT